MFSENNAACCGPVCAAEDLPVLLLGKHVADRVQHDDVVAGAEVVLQHVSWAKLDLRCDAGLADIFGSERYDLRDVKDLALHVGTSLGERDGGCAVASAFRTSGARSLAFRWMPAMKLLVHSEPSRAWLRRASGMRVPLGTASVS